MSGCPLPPTDNPNFRFIKLTAGDAYNTGVLTAESVTGTAPLVQATAQISLAGSPVNGATVHLINTERSGLRAGDSGTFQQDALQNITGYYNGPAVRRLSDESGGAFLASDTS